MQPVMSKKDTKRHKVTISKPIEGNFTPILTFPRQGLRGVGIENSITLTPTLSLRERGPVD